MLSSKVNWHYLVFYAVCLVKFLLIVFVAVRETVGVCERIFSNEEDSSRVIYHLNYVTVDIIP